MTETICTTLFSAGADPDCWAIKYLDRLGLLDLPMPQWTSTHQAMVLGDPVLRRHWSWAISTGAIPAWTMRGWRLEKAVLCWAKLIGADLTGADLTGADLSGADLLGADLTGAKLTGAKLTDADLLGADLTGAVGLTQAQLDSTVGTPASLPNYLS